MLPGTRQLGLSESLFHPAREPFCTLAMRENALFIAIVNWSPFFKKTWRKKLILCKHCLVSSVLGSGEFVSDMTKKASEDDVQGESECKRITVRFAKIWLSSSVCDFC